MTLFRTLRCILSTYLFCSLIAPVEVQAQSVPSGFNDVLVMGGWTAPVGFTFDANGRWYVWEKSGKVFIVENGVKRTTPLIDISPEVGNWRDHGCLGFALDPNFLTNGYIYLLYTVDRHHLMHFGKPTYNAATNEYYAATIMRVTRYQALASDNFNSVDPNSRFVLLGETKKTGVPMLHESHSTGQLVFGTDGTLLLTVGDGASYNNVDVGSDGGTYFAQALLDSIIRPAENVGAMRSQLLNCHNGKLLRMDPMTGNGVPSNPYYDPANPRSPKSRVWALGLRNPFRMTLRPNSGGTDPTEGRPGAFYIGDVGWNVWEDLHVSYEGGMNFGWPIFEGMENHTEYTAALTANQDAPNPLYGQLGCTQQYFNFQDLLKQESPIHLNGHPNPCDAMVQVPTNIPTWFHSRPAIDWRHGTAQSRCAGFNGNTPVTYDLDAVNSPVPGPRFAGNAAGGSAWITGQGWPVGYQNTYFQADYGGAWIRRFNFNAQEKPTAGFNFGTAMGAVVFLKEGPDGGLWYVKYESNAIRKVVPAGVTDLPPTAAGTQSAVHGPGPLNVSFTAAGSSDPENGALTYAWNFGDGGTATGFNAAHTFTPLPGVPTSYTVTLTVTDNASQTNSTTFLVSVNNTPPQVAITSFPDNHHYPLGVDTIYALQAAVSDAEQGVIPLGYAWQTVFHHNAHTHPEAIDHAVTSNTVISGVGCYDEEYYYKVHLTVTDAHGLSTEVVHTLLPRCTSIRPTAIISSSTVYAVGAFTTTIRGTESTDNGTIVSYLWDFGDGTTASGPQVEKTFSQVGEYQVTLTVTDNDGLTNSTTKPFTVLTLDAPQCVGASGSVLREYWTGVSGGTVSTLLASPSYPNSPSGTTYPTTIQGPTDWANNYGTRIRGYIIAPETGVYNFTLTSDDASVFSLSPNAQPQYAQAICSVSGYTGAEEYTKYSTQRSANITLQAGAYYYFEVLHKEGSGGDHVAVRWQRPSNQTIALIPAANLARWQDCQPSITLRASLQGAQATGSSLMRDDLRAAGSIPLTEPYTGLGFTHAGGGGGETVAPAMLAITGMNAVVDWVLVEVRSATAPHAVLATRSALLQRDGDIVDVNGRRRLIFNVAAGNYRIALRHRNHLGVMNGTTLLLNGNDRYLDLTQAITVTYGTNAQTALANGRQALWSGNVLRDGELKYTGTNNDRDPILMGVGGIVPTQTASGYLQGDVNMDGVIKYTGTGNDRDPILMGIGGVVPTATRLQQLP
ncbi:MAG TPA: PKD domain-containing protein [Flavobacteriales bacterium]